MEPIRYPSITGSEVKQQLGEIKRYLFQLADQLNYILARLEKGERITRKPSAQKNVAQ